MDGWGEGGSEPGEPETRPRREARGQRGKEGDGRRPALERASRRGAAPRRNARNPMLTRPGPPVNRATDSPRAPRSRADPDHRPAFSAAVSSDDSAGSSSASASSAASCSGVGGGAAGFGNGYDFAIHRKPAAHAATINPANT